MNDVKKGAVTVVLATVVTSVMILMSGKGNADNAQSVTSKAHATNNEKTTVEIVEVKNIVEEVVKAEVVGTTEVNKLVANELSDKLLPPPGPFSKEASVAKGMPQAPQVSAPPVSPEAPKESVTKKPGVPQAPDRKVEKPALQAIAPEAPKKVDKVEVKPVGVKAPQMVTKKPNFPFTPKVPSLSAEPKKSPELPTNIETTKQRMLKVPAAPRSKALDKPIPNHNNQPIWMQNNNVNATNSAPQMNQSTNNRPNPTNGQQMPNPYGDRYMQQYRYMPMPVYPNYQYPQMPRHNGGYYFAPIPNYWMQRGMQMPNPQTRMKMNQAPQAPSGLEGSSK